MAQNVFRADQIIKNDDKVMLKFAKEFKAPVSEEVEEAEEYTGPTVEELKQQADEFKANWEAEKEKMLAEAQASADEIVKKAEDKAFQQVKQQNDQAQIIKNEAQKQADEIIKKANEEAASIIASAHEKETEILNKANEDGFKKGQEDGFKEGKEEADRLIERLHKMITSVQEKRQEILDGTEQEIVNLVLLISRKVVKILSENQKSVIMANVIQALKKVKGRGEVTLRVNTEDLNLTTEHVGDFVKQVENIKDINIVEDSSVEKGGCIVETDFGAIDARISSQLNELENQILNVSPIKSVSKADTGN